PAAISFYPLLCVNTGRLRWRLTIARRKDINHSRAAVTAIRAVVGQFDRKLDSLGGSIFKEKSLNVRYIRDAPKAEESAVAIRDTVRGAAHSGRAHGFKHLKASHAFPTGITRIDYTLELDTFFAGAEVLHGRTATNALLGVIYPRDPR